MGSEMKVKKKRAVALLLALMLAMFILSSCGTAESDEDVFVIDERFFVARYFDIIYDTERYIGRTIQYEGMFFARSWEGRDFYIVTRYTIGCCGEELIGFEVLLDDVPSFPDNTWVEVTGVLDRHDDSLVVRAITIIEMDERGAEFVQ